MAVQYLARQNHSGPVSVAEIASECQISEGLLSKILQELRKKGWVEATRGTLGGYSLATQPSEISFLSFVEVFEEKVGVVECAQSGATGCAQFHGCGLRSPLLALNDRLNAWLDDLSLDQVFESKSPPPEEQRDQGDLSVTG